MAVSKKVVKTETIGYGKSKADYATVNERIKFFRERPEFKGWGMETFREDYEVSYHMVDRDGKIKEIKRVEVLIKAVVYDEQGRIKASGIAQEDFDSEKREIAIAKRKAAGKFGDGMDVNETSAVENCETSAVGRALANLGILVDGGYASQDEVDRAIEKQEINSEMRNMDKVTKTANDIMKKFPDGIDKELLKQGLLDKKKKGLLDFKNINTMVNELKKKGVKVL
jgi:hypothetical protein